MSTWIKLGVLSFFTAVVVGFILCGESSAAPREDFYDSSGRCVASVIKGNDGKPKLLHHKPAPRPAPKPAPKYKSYETKEAVKRTVVGAGVGAAVSAIPSAGIAAGPGALVGGGTGFATYTAEWAYDNAVYAVTKYAELKDRQCRVEAERLKKATHPME